MGNQLGRAERPRAAGDRGQRARTTPRPTSCRRDNRIFIVNNVLYAVELDHGSSRQAPAGIVAVTMAQVRAELEEIIAEHGG